MSEADLLRAVVDAPDDMDARHVYGDALASQGNARGELIHVQCELDADVVDRARRTLLLRREAELLGKCGKGWVAPILRAVRNKHGHRMTFRRGMIERVFARADELASTMGDIVEREPVTQVGVVELTPESASALAAVGSPGTELEFAL